MQSSMKDLPAVTEAPHITLRQIEWGGMTVEAGSVRQTVDPALTAPFFKGLPDDRCQCPHWGYVIKGQMRMKFADHEEIYNAGEVFYAAPGHIPVSEAGCEFVDFSPADQMRETMEVLAQNQSSMRPGAHSG